MDGIRRKRKKQPERAVMVHRRRRERPERIRSDKRKMTRAGGWNRLGKRKAENGLSGRLELSGEMGSRKWPERAAGSPG